MDGWIKLHRQILNNSIVCKDSDYIAVWIYLLLNATHKEHDSVFGKDRIKLQPGQLITGRKVISDKFKIDESKVQRILKKLESEHQIKQQTSNKNRLITILNWNTYQESEQQNKQQVNNKCTSSEHIQECKKVKNEKNIFIDLKFIDDVIDKVNITKAQYDKLKDKFGDLLLHKQIIALDNYIANGKGNRYKDHYRALNTWCNKDSNKTTGVSSENERKYD